MPTNPEYKQQNTNHKPETDENLKDDIKNEKLDKTSAENESKTMDQNGPIDSTTPNNPDVVAQRNSVVIQHLPLQESARINTEHTAFKANSAEMIAANVRTLSVKPSPSFTADNSVLKSIVRSTGKFPSMPNRVTFTSRVVHCTSLYINNGGGSPTFLPNNVDDPFTTIYIEEAKKPFVKGVKEAIFGIKSNFAVKIKSDPYSPNIIDLPGLEQIDSTTQYLQTLSDIGPVLNRDEDMQRILNIVIALTSVGRDIGGYMYVNSHEHLYDYVTGDHPLTDSASSFHIPGIYVGFDPEAKNNLGFMRYGTIVNNVFSENGSTTLVRDDFNEYPSILLTSLVMPTETQKRFCADKVKIDFPIGIHTSNVGTIYGRKYFETATLPTDVISKKLNAINLRDLEAHITDEESLVAFYNRFFPMREMYDANVSQYMFHKISRKYVNEIDAAVQHVYTICDDQAKNATMLSYYLHPTLLHDIFRDIVTEMQSVFNTFPFISIDASLSAFTKAESSVNTDLLNVMNDITAYTTPVATEDLAIKMALSIMSHYVCLTAVPTTFSQTKDPFIFSRMLLGFYYDNILFSQLYKRNKPSRYQTIHDFLLCFFRYDYSLIFSKRGFGTTRAGVVIKTISGLDSLTCPIENWTIDEVYDGTNPVLGSVMRALRFSNDNDITVPFRHPDDNRYALNNRNMRIPGALLGPDFEDTAPYTPLYEKLHTILDIGHAYYRRYLMNNDSRTDFEKIKMKANSFNAYMFGLQCACDSASRWFHTVYCTIYFNAMNHPLLFENDDAEPSLRPAYMDRYKFDEPGTRLSVPHARPTPVSLQGIPSTLYTGRITVEQGFCLLITATAPGPRCQGLTMRDVVNLPAYQLYKVLYSGTSAITKVNNYLEMVYRCLLTMEQLELIQHVVRGNFLDFIPELRDILVQSVVLTSTSAASMATILRAFQYHNLDLDKEVLSMAEGIIGILLRDPRFIRLVRTYISTDDYTGTRHITMYRPSYRQYVIESAQILINMMFSDGGIKPIYKGATMARSPITDLNYVSTHPNPDITVTVGPNKSLVFAGDYNYNTMYTAKAVFADGTIRNYSIQNAYALFNKIRNDSRDPSVPLFKIICPNYNSLTNVQIEFITECLNGRYCVLKNETINVSVSYEHVTSIEADEENIPITVESVKKFMCSPPAYRKSMRLQTIATATHTGLQETCVKNELPDEPLFPNIIMSNFYQNATSADTMISTEVSYQPVPTEPTQDPLVYIHGLPEDAYTNAMFNQWSYHRVLTHPPIISMVFDIIPDS